ncbi:hypothetical protein [Leisingera sp. M658]|uniref:hypothetical protein n=1 Tax=Leisingera sp. M658 TaxID=2867015 RepID=UPI0021A51D12|nr:hypothetical protein [Leisingera sp. M658]UWQ74403.1 hypothetical protein K3724_18265 [Leisingera sp. M658]
MKFFKCIILSLKLALVAPISHAQPLDSCVDVSQDSLASELIRCVTEVTQLVDRLARENRYLWSEVYGLKDDLKRTKLEALPRGAVVAFDTPSGCPIGWNQFKLASGRVIIGTGFGGGNTAADGPLTERRFREVGGHENHTLTVEEMPAHRHGIPMVAAPHDYLDDGKGTDAPYFDFSERKDVSIQIGDSDPDQGVYTRGEGKPHNNMPPYIALYLCKKGEL